MRIIKHILWGHFHAKSVSVFPHHHHFRFGPYMLHFLLLFDENNVNLLSLRNSSMFGNKKKLLVAKSGEYGGCTQAIQVFDLWCIQILLNFSVFFFWEHLLVKMIKGWCPCCVRSKIFWSLSQFLVFSSNILFLVFLQSTSL